MLKILFIMSDIFQFDCKITTFLRITVIFPTLFGSKRYRRVEKFILVVKFSFHVVVFIVPRRGIYFCLRFFQTIYKFWLAAAAAIIGGVRCHHWQRPLPIMSPPAANLKSTSLFPRRCLPLPVCRALTLLNAPYFARHQQCSTACHHSFSELFADSVYNSCLSSKD